MQCIYTLITSNPKLVRGFYFLFHYSVQKSAKDYDKCLSLARVLSAMEISKQMIKEYDIKNILLIKRIIYNRNQLAIRLFAFKLFKFNNLK